MQIKYLEDGGMELTNHCGTITLNAADVWNLYHDITRNNNRRSLYYSIKQYDDWCFEQSQESVLQDEWLMDSMLEQIEFENIDIDDEDELFALLESYLDVVY